MPPTNSLPSRLRESSFRKYEDDIAKIVENFPTAIVFTPKGNVITYVARLRDAILSFQIYAWESNVIDRAKFAQAYENMVVSHSHENDKVLAGGRLEVKKARLGNEQGILTEFKVGYTQTAVELNETELDSNQVAFLCLLASKRLLTNPIRTNCMNAEDKRHLEDEFDVMIEDNQDGTFTII